MSDSVVCLLKFISGVFSYVVFGCRFVLFFVDSVERILNVVRREELVV